MKIGFVLDDGMDKPDGVQQYILSLGEWFAAHGHEIRFIVGETKRTDLPHVHSMAKNVRVKFNGNALSIPLPASSSKIKKLLKKENFDVIHVQVPYSPFMGAKVVKNADPRTAVVGTFHILPYGWLSRIGTRLLGIYLSRNLRRFDRMFSVSEPAAEFAQSTFKVKSDISPNSVHIAEFRSGKHQKSNDLRILFLGRLVPRKGARQLLESIKILSDRGALPGKIVVDICGDGPLRQDLERYVSDNGLGKIVRFHGFVTRARKIDFMASADISIFPSLSGESFGIVLLEAMAAGGGIVLGGNNPGYRSVMHAVPGSIIEPRDTGLMSDQILVFIEDEKKRRSLYKAQQKHIKQFDTEIVASNLLKAYEACKSVRRS